VRALISSKYSVFVEILGVAVHHPNAGVGDILDLAARAVHDSGEDRQLVRDQER
jgi:hypothetical protein